MRVTLTALALAGMLLLSGCSATLLPYAREMGDMALLRTMGVDAGEGDYQVEVTVSTGKRAYGLQGESQPSLVLSAQRESLSAACLAMQGLSDSYVFYGYVDQLLLGEGLIQAERVAGVGLLCPGRPAGTGRAAVGGAGRNCRPGSTGRR